MELTLDEALQKAIEAHKAGQIQEADRLYTAMLQAQPKHPDANHNMGVLAVGVGKVQEALPFFKTALEANPSIGQYWLSYIDALIKLDRMVDAQTVLDQAKGMGAKGEAFDQLEQRLNVPNGVSIDPAQDQLDTLISLYQQGQLQQTLDSAKQLLSQFPDSLTLYNIQGAANAQLGQLDAAIESYKQALKINPDYAEAYNNIGITLKDKGDLEAAIDSYKQAVKIRPDYADAYYNMGIALRDKDDLEAAIDSYKQALKIKPNYAQAYNNIGNALKDKGDLEAAIDSYKQALKIKPNYADAYYNMGIAMQDKGDLNAAMDNFKQALKIKPDNAEVYYHIGNALNAQGDLEAAINSYKYALKIKPDFADVYYNMSASLQGKGDLEAAIDSYHKALKIKPDFAEAYNNMGAVLQDQGDVQAAIDSYQQALKINPDYAEAYNNMGAVLQNQGDQQAAIDSYQKALKIKSDYADAYNNMGNALKGIVFNKPNSGLMEIIVSLLDKRTSCRPRDIAEAAISLLKIEPILKELLEKNSLGTVSQSVQETISTLAELPLLLKLMSVCPIADLELERVLVNIRLALLSSVDQIFISPTILRFQSALALQCFTNEYIYTQTDKETELLDVLKNVVEKALSNGQQPSPQSVLCLASYQALIEFEWCDLLTVNTNIEEVFLRQILEPKEEGRLEANIPILQEITDNVSSKVRDQYEENPYPRWVNLGLSLRPKTTAELIKELNLRIFDNAANDRPAPNISIAGCGTGQHSIGSASRFKDSNVLAIDLSLSSLAYAKRKTEELGLQNIDYMQADLLDLGKFDKKFDIIESTGVLHHMDDPMAGWRVLTDCLGSGGLMRIGLYSESARQVIVKIREEINQSGMGSSDEAMKLFRSNIINSNEQHHKNIRSSNDFYSLSELRDLLFHVQEHRFTIPEIKDCLTELGLKFCGFESDEIVRGFKLTNTGTDDPYDLDKWDLYEKDNPNSFAGMYQFWCQKVN
ncbi:tetratricopeptide repeat protein [Candidatus Njordibacter sp. Uisw_058]|uniref:tetratricopeptide repeat protein n=1 Tax=Candidatus Njordibacter sp. Uisw_058 TaxID=3230974 RepID=UPI003D5787B6